MPRTVPSPFASALSLLAILASALGAPAQTLPDTVALERITVTVSSRSGTAGGASAVQASLDSLPLTSAPLLSEALRQLPLLQVRDNSRGEAELSLRGTGSRQIAVLVDGVPLTLGWDDRTDLSVVPAAIAREIRIVRGLSSVLHGPNVLGGAIKIRSAGAAQNSPARPSVRITSGIDHLGGKAFDVAATRVYELAGGALETRMGGGYRGRDGFARSGGVEGSTAGSFRANSDLEHVSGYGTARFRTPRGALVSLSSFAYRAEKGVPPELHIEEPRYWRIPDTHRWVTTLTVGTGWRETPLGLGDLEAAIGVDVGRTEIHAYETADYRSVVEREIGDDRTVSLRLLGDHTVGAVDLRGAITWAETRHRERLEPGGVNVYRQRLWSAGVEAERPLGERLRVSVGASMDGADTPETGEKPDRGRIGEWGGRIGATMDLGRGAALNGGLSRKARFPALRELYSGALGKFVPNPDLEPEVLVVTEGGVTGKIGAATLQAVGFHQRLEDAIVRVPVGDAKLQRANRDEVRAIGIELLGDWRRGGFSASAALTLQRVRIHDPAAAESVRHPEYEPAVAGSLDLEAPLGAGFRGLAGVDYRGRQYCVHPDLGRDVTLSPSVRSDFAIARLWHMPALPLGNLETFVALDNATNATVYDRCGLPQPGRTLRFEIRFAS
jgi:iron complex outermembrane receptor protein